MKTQNIHIGSLIIGLLAGAVILLVVALSQPLRNETRTSQLIRNDTHQVQVTTTRGVDKTWAQFRSELNLDWHKMVQYISQNFNKYVSKIGSSLHSSALQPCVWLGWLDRQMAHLATLVNLHTGYLNPPTCIA
jgi:gas vesicle protein